MRFPNALGVHDLHYERSEHTQQKNGRSDAKDYDGEPHMLLTLKEVSKNDLTASLVRVGSKVHKDFVKNAE